MPNSIVPTQIGQTSPDSPLRSQVYIGRNVSVSFEAIGIGDGGRPDELQALKIYISKDGVKYGAIHFDVEDIADLFTDIPDLLSEELFLKPVKVSVCEVNETTGEGEEKQMVVLGSKTYAIA